MQYPKNVFWQNLEAARRFGDNDMVMDLFADQTTDIALAHPDALNAALANAGIKVDKNNNDPNYLTDLVGDNLHNNPKLINNLALMIADTNTPKSAGGKWAHDATSGDQANADAINAAIDAQENATYGGGSSSASPSSSSSSSSALSGVSGIADLISKVTPLASTIAGAIGGKKKAAELTKQKMADALKAKADDASAATKATAAATTATASSKTFLAIGLGLVVCGVIGFGLYLLNKDMTASQTQPSIAPTA